MGIDTLDIFDMHCHLGFYDDPTITANELRALGIGVFCTTVTPSEYEQMSRLVALPNVRLGVGLHPWWLADGRAGATDAKRVAEIAESERYIGEVGLDFSRDNARQAELQISSLDAILAACESTEHVFSLHAVKSAGAVLDLLEKHRTCKESQVILHWFSGSSDELARARKLGCFFSVNHRMLDTRRGREYARQLPTSRLLLETDLPCEPGGPIERTAAAHAALLRQTLERLCELRDEDVSASIATASKAILSI